MPKFCTNCGSPLPEGAKFCTACGTAVELAAAPVPAPAAEPERPTFVNEDHFPPYTTPAEVAPAAGEDAAAPAPAFPTQAHSESSATRSGEFHAASAATGKDAKKRTDAAAGLSAALETAKKAAAPLAEKAKNSAAPLAEKAKASVAPLAEKVKQSAAELTAEAADAVKSAAEPLTEKAMSAAEPFEALASSNAGEVAVTAFGGASDAAAGAGEILAPLKTLLGGVTSLVQSAKGLLRSKDTKRLLIAGAIALVWIVLLILRRLGLTGFPVNLLDWFTFAHGGTGRGLLGGIGGLIGKGVVATALYSLFTGGLSSVLSGAKSLLRGGAFRDKATLPVLLLGSGGALILYQFFAGYAALSDTMAALSGAALSLQALGNGGGWLFRMAQSLVSKKTGGARLAKGASVTALLSGAAAGFALGAVLSAIPFGYLPLILGGVCVIAGIVLGIVFKNKKEVSAA